MITFQSLLWIWRSDSAGTWYFVTVPEDQSADIKAQALGSPRGFGSVQVEATIAGVSWRTSVFPLNGGGYILPVKKAVRSSAGIAAGDDLTVHLDLVG